MRFSRGREWGLERGGRRSPRPEEGGLLSTKKQEGGDGAHGWCAWLPLGASEEHRHEGARIKQLVDPED